MQKISKNLQQASNNASAEQSAAKVGSSTQGLSLRDSNKTVNVKLKKSSSTKHQNQ